jgi:hypothetical protein
LGRLYDLKLGLFLGILILSNFINKAQNLNIKEYEFKTNQIVAKCDSDLTVKSIAVLPSFVEWRFYPDWSYRKKIFKGESLKHIKRFSADDSTYVIIPELENFYSNKVNSKLLRMLALIDIEKKRVNIGASDSIFLIRELKRLKNLFKDSTVNQYNISDSLFEVLKKFNSDQCVIYDLLTIHLDSRTHRALDLIGVQKIYVFDIRIRELIYFQVHKRRIYGDEQPYWEPVPHDFTGQPYFYDDFPKPQKVFKGYIKYLRKSKKYLEKQK